MHTVTRKDGATIAIQDLAHHNIGFRPHPIALESGARPLSALMGRTKNAVQTILTLDNGVSVSVICGDLFYSNGVDTYEAMVVAGPQELVRTHEEPAGHRNIYGLIEYLLKVANRKPMRKYKVEVREVSIITYEVTAESEFDARERAMENGMEVDEELLDHEIISAHLLAREA